MIDKIKGLLKLLLMKIIVFFFNLIFWDKKKDVLVVWVVVITLFLRPVKNADAIYLLARSPPPYAAAEVENDNLLKAGWKILQEYWDGKCGEEKLQIAKKIFKQVYQKTRNPVVLILDYTTDQYLAIEKKTYRESKEILLKKLQAIEERLKIYPNDAWSITEKHITLIALFDAAYGLYFDTDEYREYRNKDEIDLYYKDAIEYGKKLIEFEKELMTNIVNSVLKEYTSKGFREISDIEKDEIKNYTKSNLSQHEKMYDELIKKNERIKNVLLKSDL